MSTRPAVSDETTLSRRTRVEGGLLIAVLTFVVVLAFNAGIQYDRQVHFSAVQAKHTTQIHAINQALNEDKNNTQVRLTRIETLLTQMQRTQQEIQARLSQTDGR